MARQDYETELFNFFEEYAEFLEKLNSDEEEKLSSLLSNSIERIEHAISVGQANAKQMENMERRRIRLQEKAGYAGMTFSEIIESAPDEERVGLEALLHRVITLAENIQFQNKKSMGVARDNLHIMNLAPETLAGASKQATAYVRASEKTRVPSISLLETKI